MKTATFALIYLITSMANAAPTQEPAQFNGRLNVRLSWGHTTPKPASFFIKLAANEVAVSDLLPENFEPGDSFTAGICHTQAGAGDMDGLAFTLQFPERTIKPITNLHSIWRYLLENSDPDARRRLLGDPGYRPDSRKLTVQMDAEATKGFSVTVDQLLTNRVFWIPGLDVVVSTGEPPISFAEHRLALQPFHGRRIIDRIQAEPEASYEQFTGLWEDMGSPQYENPAAPPPGHIVCLTWDSALYKFGVDRWAGVRNDLGNPDHFRFDFQFGLPAYGAERGQPVPAPTTWKSQKLDNGLPVITTTFENGGVRYEVEQFAYPLHGPPAERNGDIPMVLLQKARVTELEGKAQSLAIGLTYQRQLLRPGDEVLLETNQQQLLWKETRDNRILLALEGDNFMLVTNTVQGAKTITNFTQIAIALQPKASAEFVVKLPSPLVPATGREAFFNLDYAKAREQTIKFWSDYLERGAHFIVPEEPVNTLFRANLWHALRLPRRHGGAGTNVSIDLPYSNFAYGQAGTPWPVNQAVYVDYMLYDLRGYHDLAAEELEVMFRNNQEPDGHIKGYANWGVYTPSLIYSVAKHYLLSGQPASFDKLLPATLKASAWCLGEMGRAASQSGPAQGLILAPLNDLSHDLRAWAFNQAYFFAGMDLLGKVLDDIRHPRAQEYVSAALLMRDAVERGFAHASMLSPLVQLRDHTWSPYAPCDALTPQRLLNIWYPTDIDSGPLHLSRLQALDPRGPLTTALLLDHEDNLFLKGLSMANEPVYNQHATAYLLRDEPKAVIRAFYSMMACAFSHSVFEPVEHRWAWGQYFGPPSTDGAWFELYRQMLIHEWENDTLLLLQATPRKWLEHGKRIQVERAPTYYGPLSMVLESRVGERQIRATIDMPNRKQPSALLVRLRHPNTKPIRAVSVNGQEWRDFDVEKEWIQIPAPKPGRYEIIANY